MQANPYQAPHGAPPGYGGGDRQDGRSAGYEFTAQENAVISSTARWTRRAGIIQAIVGGLFGIGAASALSKGNTAGGGGNALAAAVFLAIGLLFIGAAGALGRVVSTQGNDIHHLMEAMKAYQRAFKIHVILVILSVIVGFAAAFMALAAFDPH